MKNTFYILSAIVIFSAVAFAQKGIDTQTDKIKQEGTSTPQTNTRTNNPTARSIDWGKGKTKVRPPLANPFRLNSRPIVFSKELRLTSPMFE